MLKIRSYEKVKSVAEAYELNQKKTACVLGGMVWLKMSNRTVSTAIDLSNLGLDMVQELEDEFVIGCMTPLRDIETDQRLNTYTHGAMKECMRHIVGVQFRNCATIGGSIYSRYGFSDVLTLFLAMDTYVELYKAGRVPLHEFVNMEKDRDILVNVIIKKAPLAIAYFSQRNSETDFPVLTCAAAYMNGETRTVIGARPARAMIVEDKKQILKDFRDMGRKKRREAILSFAEYAAENVHTGSNMRASQEYRKLLVGVLTKRAWEAVGGMKYED